MKFRMDLEEHERECMKELGEPWTHVHVFMDRYAKEYRGFVHRRLLHHRLGIELAVRAFGEEARMAATLHVQQDLGFVPEDWTALEQYSFFLGDEEERQEEVLRELYGAEVFGEIEGRK